MDGYILTKNVCFIERGIPMQDRVTKVLLSFIALLLVVLLLRPQMPAVHAQSSGQPSPTMVVSGGSIYVLQNNHLSLYQLEAGVTPPQAFAMQFTGVDEQDRLTLLKRTRLYHIFTKDLSKAETPKEMPLKNKVFNLGQRAGTGSSN